MKLRTLILGVVILALLSVAVYLRNRPAAAPAADPRVGQTVLGPDTVAQAAGLVVSDQGKKVELAKGSDGVWRVTSYYGLPADFDKITQLIRDLNEAKIDRLVTTSPDRLERLEFKDSFIALRDAAGHEIWKLTLGKAPESGNGKFLRFGAEPRAYFSGMRVWLDTDAKGWADALLPTVKADEVAKISVALPGGIPVVATRAKKDDPWSAEPPPGLGKLISDKATTLVNALTGLRFSDTIAPTDPAVAAAAPFTRTFVLTTFDGREVRVSLGRKPEEKKLKPPVADASPIAKTADGKPDEKPLLPEYDTVPAGPVLVAVAHPREPAPIDALMRTRAFEVDDSTFTSLPQAPADLFSPAEKAK